jgi:Flp pilus assembly protein TadD
MNPAVRPWCAAIVLVLIAAGGAAAVDDSDDDPNAARDPSFVAARQAIRGQQYGAAIRLLHDALLRDSQDPDTHNLLGFAYRKTGDLDRAFRHYHEALRLAPQHRGAHEYIGEAYLMRGDLARAEEHLRELNRLCRARCDERDDLQAAIDQHKARRQSGGVPDGTR